MRNFQGTLEMRKQSVVSAFFDLYDFTFKLFGLQLKAI